MVLYLRDLDDVLFSNIKVFVLLNYITKLLFSQLIVTFKSVLKFEISNFVFNIDVYIWKIV